MTNKILIVGYGNIGKHMHQELQGAGTITIYDKFIAQYSTIPTATFDFAFICVPTDMLPDGSADTSIVQEAVHDVKSNIIVIKSTVPVGTCTMLSSMFPEKHIVFSPEYYGTTQHAPQSPNFVVFAGNPTDCDQVAQLYYKVKTKEFRIHFTDYKTAELAKYMENCFLALKVTFCAEFATIAKEYGISYPQLREIFVLDERMGDSHTFINPEQPYYDSHCLNKDIPALIAQSDKAHLMKAVSNINKQKRIENWY